MCSPVFESAWLSTTGRRAAMSGRGGRADTPPGSPSSRFGSGQMLRHRSASSLSATPGRSLTRSVNTWRCRCGSQPPLTSSSPSRAMSVPGADRPDSERLGIQVAVQREEAVVLEHEQPAVVAALVAVLAHDDRAVERRVHRRARRREDVDRHVPRPPAPVRRLELGRGVDRALLVVAPDRQPVDRRHPGPEVEHGRGRQITLHDRVRPRAREELPDRPRARARLVPAGVAEPEVRERVILGRQARQHPAHAGLRDQQVLVVRLRRVLARGHRDAHLQPRADQRIEHGQLVLAQRRDLVVAAHDRHDRARRVRRSLHRIGGGDRQPAHARAVHDVAEVDQPADGPVLADQHVVLVGVVVDDLLGEAGRGPAGRCRAPAPAAGPTGAGGACRGG